MLGLRGHLAGKRHVLWDWNGTLLNDVDLCVDIIGGILEEHALERIDRDAYLQRFRFPVREYYAELGFDFARHPFEALSQRFIDRFEHGVLSCSLFDGVRELLAELKHHGVRCSVLSAAHEGHLRAQLTHHGIFDAFEHVCGTSDFYAHGKVERGRQLLAALDERPEDVVLVGDTDHDLEVGRALGIDVVLVAGHQCAARLARAHGVTVMERRRGGSRHDDAGPRA